MWYNMGIMKNEGEIDMKKFNNQVAENLEDVKKNVERNYEIVANITEFPSIVVMTKT